MAEDLRGRLANEALSAWDALSERELRPGDTGRIVAVTDAAVRVVRDRVEQLIMHYEESERSGKTLDERVLSRASLEPLRMLLSELSNLERGDARA